MLTRIIIGGWGSERLSILLAKWPCCYGQEASKHMATMSNCLPNSGLPPTQLEGRPLTSIVLNLTSPKFHFATLELTQSDIRFSISRILCVAWPGCYRNDSEPKDKAHCDSIIFIASTKCKITKQQTPLTKTFFFCLRYNISTDDYDGWSTNSSHNNK